MGVFFRKDGIGRVDREHAKKTSCLGVSGPTATSVLRTFERLGILAQANPKAKRNLRFVFTRYLEILEEGTH